MEIWLNMLVYRITLIKYAHELQASGRAARWNFNDVKMIYTSSSRSLACLENIVHRSQSGLNQQFHILTVELPEAVTVRQINNSELPADWKEFNQMPLTQNIGSQWISRAESLLLRVPSSIIQDEHNYLINPSHPSFSEVRIQKTEPFVFDTRIKRTI